MRKALIVDDEAEVVEFLANFLKRREVKTYTVTSGKEALKILKEQDIDFMLLDINMPQMDGIELLKIIRRENINTKVIMVTGREDKASISKARKFGVEEYIVKPLELEQLHSVITKLL